jgi:hypothetical protein
MAHAVMEAHGFSFNFMLLVVLHVAGFAVRTCGTGQSGDQ